MTQSADISPPHVCQTTGPSQSDEVPKPAPIGKKHEKRRGKIQLSLSGLNHLQPDLDSQYHPWPWGSLSLWGCCMPTVYLAIYCTFFYFFHVLNISSTCWHINKQLNPLTATFTHAAVFYPSVCPLMHIVIYQLGFRNGKLLSSKSLTLSLCSPLLHRPSYFNCRRQSDCLNLVYHLPLDYSQNIPFFHVSRNVCQGKSYKSFPKNWMQPKSTATLRGYEEGGGHRDEGARVFRDLLGGRTRA